MVERTNNRIIFKIPTVEMWESIKAKTAFRAKFAFATNPDAADIAALSDSDLEFMLTVLKDAVMSAHLAMVRLMWDIPYSETFAVNQYYAPTSGDGSDAINPNDYPVDIREKQSRIIVNDNGQYTDALLAGIDNAITEVVSTYILTEWWKRVGAVDDAKMSLSQYITNISNLKKQIVELFKLEM